MSKTPDRFSDDPYVRLGARLTERETDRLYQEAIAAERLGTIKLVSLEGLVLKRARWLWADRLAQGRVSLLAGRESIGKSTISADLGAAVTRGKLPGEYEGTPRGVIVVATEDDYAVTIGPRLVAAGADMARVFVIESTLVGAGISLPADLPALELLAPEHDVALMILDPMISRLGELDTHRDAEVRRALEPLTLCAERAAMAVMGLIHLNKTGTTDPMRAIMGSVAFTAVARSVLMAGVDPDDESRVQCLLSNPKNNLGKPAATLKYTISERTVGEDEGAIVGSRVEWHGEDARTGWDLMAAGVEVKSGAKRRSAGSWLEDYLELHGETNVKVIEGAAAAEGISRSTLNRARKAMEHVERSRAGYQGASTWKLKGDNDDDS